MKDVLGSLALFGMVIGAYAGVVVLVANWIWGGPALPLAVTLIAWPVAAIVTMVVFFPLAMPLTRWEESVRRRLPGSAFDVIQMTPFAAAFVASFVAVFALWSSMVGAPPWWSEIASMPKDLTFWLAIVLAGLIGVIFVSGYRRFARRWPQRSARGHDFDSDEDANGAGDGGDGGGGD